MLIVITGLDGSGTSTIAEELHMLDKGSTLVRTPSIEYSSREMIDSKVRETSQMAHYLYYLSSVKYMSDYIKQNTDYKEKNVYCVKYLIDTVVSHKTAGLNVELDYQQYDILKPDLTIFVTLDEKSRQARITKRGKSIWDKVLDDDEKRRKIVEAFSGLLDEKTIYFNNQDSDVKTNVKKLYQQIISKNKNI